MSHKQRVSVKTRQGWGLRLFAWRTPTLLILAAVISAGLAAPRSPAPKNDRSPTGSAVTTGRHAPARNNAPRGRTSVSLTSAGSVAAAAHTTFARMRAFHQSHPNLTPSVRPYLRGPGPRTVPFARLNEAATNTVPSRDRKGAGNEQTDPSRDRKGAGQPVQPVGAQIVPGVRETSSAILAPPLLTNFQGVIDNGVVIPPDTMGAVGPNHIVEFLNTGFTVFNRTGGVVQGQVSLTAFWSALPLNLTGLTDPKILFDTQSDRWIAASDTDCFVLVAMSLSNDPTGAWNLCAITADASGSTFPDFPGLGVDTVNVYLTNNMFNFSNGSFLASQFWVITKTSILSGGLLVGVAIGDPTGGFTYQPGHSFDNVPGGLNYIVSEGWVLGSRRFVRILKLTGVGVAATLTDLGFIEVNTYNFTQGDAPQDLCATPVSTNDTRLLNAVVRMDTLWTTHSVANAAVKTEVAWYELNPNLANPAGSNFPNQQGRVSDPSRYYFFPSIAVNQDKCVALAFSGSDASSFISGYFTVHTPTALPGSTQPVGLLHAGVAPYFKPFSGSTNRWGDYSATVVDPLDDRTFWTVQEYAEFQFPPSNPGEVCSPNRGMWATWWGSFQCCPDADGDGVCDNVDNCPNHPNPNQADCDQDGTGDVCAIASGLSNDCNNNIIPDECETLGGGDFNNNGRVDLDDWAAFVDCMAGPGAGPNPTSFECVQACLDAFDFDFDGHIDLDDVARFASTFTGP